MRYSVVKRFPNQKYMPSFSLVVLFQIFDFFEEINQAVLQYDLRYKKF